MMPIPYTDCCLVHPTEVVERCLQLFRGEQLGDLGSVEQLVNRSSWREMPVGEAALQATRLLASSPQTCPHPFQLTPQHVIPHVLPNGSYAARAVVVAISQAAVAALSSSPGGCPSGPSRNRARRFPPLGSSAEESHGARAQI